MWDDGRRMIEDSHWVIRVSYVYHVLYEAKKVAPGRKASKHTPRVNSGSTKTLPL